MADYKKSMEDYATVAERIEEFYKKHPKGALRRIGDLALMEIGGKPFVVYTAGAWRDAATEHPDGVGTAWEPIPGPTPYTRDSEAMNAETAAWGRAIVACGAATAKKPIASREEVQNRQAPATQPAVEASRAQGQKAEAVEGTHTSNGRPAQNGADSTPQQRILRALASIPDVADRTKWCADNGLTYSKTAILDLPADRAEALLASLVVVA